jgi:hypothetical protein
VVLMLLKETGKEEEQLGGKGQIRGERQLGGTGNTSERIRSSYEGQETRQRELEAVMRDRKHIKGKKQLAGTKNK